MLGGVPEGYSSSGRGQCSNRPFAKGRSQNGNFTQQRCRQSGLGLEWLCGSLCPTGNCTLSTVVFNIGPQGVPRGGCSRKQMATSAPECIFFFPTSASGPSQSEDLEGQRQFDCTKLAPGVMDAGFGCVAEGVTMVSPSQEEYAVSGLGQTPEPRSREVQSTRLATRWESSRALGEAVLTTLQAAKALSTRRL